MPRDNLDLADLVTDPSKLIMECLKTVEVSSYEPDAADNISYRFKREEYSLFVSNGITHIQGGVGYLDIDSLEGNEYSIFPEDIGSSFICSLKIDTGVHYMGRVMQDLLLR